MRRKKTTLNVDMFPFLSVLCSVIGVLMLFMMMIISTRVIEAEERKPVPPPEPEGQVGVEDGIDKETHRRLEEQINRKSAELADRQEEQKRLQKQLEELADLIRDKADLLEQQNLENNKPFDPDKPTLKKFVPVTDPKNRVTYKPVMLEVTSEGYLLAKDKTLFPPVKRSGVILTADPKLKALFENVRTERNKKYILLLIHPNGAETFQNLRRYWKRNFSSVHLGWEPFSSDWKLILQQQ